MYLSLNGCMAEVLRRCMAIGEQPLSVYNTLLAHKYIPYCKSSQLWEQITVPACEDLLLESPLHGPLSKRRGSEKKAYLGEMKAWLGSIVDICASMCAYNMCYSGKLS